MESQLEEKVREMQVQILELPLYGVDTFGTYKIPGTEKSVEIGNEYVYPRQADQIKDLFSIVDNSGRYVRQIGIESFVPPNHGVVVKRMEKGQITRLRFAAFYYLFDRRYSPEVDLGWDEFVKMGKPRTVSVECTMRLLWQTK